MCTTVTHSSVDRHSGRGSLRILNFPGESGLIPVVFVSECGSVACYSGVTVVLQGCYSRHGTSGGSRVYLSLM
jgi:hypothetical protein